MTVAAHEMVAAARLAELEADNGATGYTLLRFRRAPIDYLVSCNKIGPAELAAAHEYSWVFDSLTIDLKFVSINQNFVRNQRIVDDVPPTEREIIAWQVYRGFSNYWSKRRKQTGDPTLAMFVAAVIDHRQFREIAADYCTTEKDAERKVIRALKDYAVRAGMVVGEDLRVRRKSKIVALRARGAPTEMSVGS